MNLNNARENVIDMFTHSWIVKIVWGLVKELSQEWFVKTDMNKFQTTILLNPNRRRSLGWHNTQFTFYMITFTSTIDALLLTAIWHQQHILISKWAQ